MNLAPLTESPGIAMMMKMGWSSGQGLGKEGTGDVNPLQLAVKTDRKGFCNYISSLWMFYIFQKVDVDWSQVIGAASLIGSNNAEVNQH